MIPMASSASRISNQSRPIRTEIRAASLDYDENLREECDEEYSSECEQELMKPMKKEKVKKKELKKALLKERA